MPSKNLSFNILTNTFEMLVYILIVMVHFKDVVGAGGSGGVNLKSGKSPVPYKQSLAVIFVHFKDDSPINFSDGEFWLSTCL